MCHRNPTSSKGGTNTLVRFVRRDKRQAFLSKARKHELCNKDLGLTDSGRIYVNEHLTYGNKQLLGATIARKSEVGWKFVWTNGGKIFARRHETSDTIKICARSDLSKMTE